MARTAPSAVLAAWEDGAHRDWVTALGAVLRRRTGPVVVARWAPDPTAEPTPVMRDAIARGPRVYVVLTPALAARLRGPHRYPVDRLLADRIAAGRATVVLRRRPLRRVVPSLLDGLPEVDAQGTVDAVVQRLSPGAPAPGPTVPPTLEGHSEQALASAPVALRPATALGPSGWVGRAVSRLVGVAPEEPRVRGILSRRWGVARLVRAGLAAGRRPFRAASAERLQQAVLAEAVAGLAPDARATLAGAAAFGVGPVPEAALHADLLRDGVVTVEPDGTVVLAPSVVAVAGAGEAASMADLVARAAADPLDPGAGPLLGRVAERWAAVPTPLKEDAALVAAVVAALAAVDTLGTAWMVADASEREGRTAGLTALGRAAAARGAWETVRACVAAAGGPGASPSLAGVLARSELAAGAPEAAAALDEPRGPVRAVVEAARALAAGRPDQALATADGVALDAAPPDLLLAVREVQAHALIALRDAPAAHARALGALDAALRLYGDGHPTTERALALVASSRPPPPERPPAAGNPVMERLSQVLLPWGSASPRARRGGRGPDGV